MFCVKILDYYNITVHSLVCNKLSEYCSSRPSRFAPRKEPRFPIEIDSLHSRTAGLDVWNKEKYFVHARIRSPDHSAHSVVTSLSRLSYSSFS